MTGILAVLGCELLRQRGGPYFLKLSEPSLCLGYHLVSDDEHVACGERERWSSERINDQLCEIVSGAYVRETFEREGSEHRLRPAAHQLVEHSPGMGRTAVHARERHSERLQVLGCVDVQRQRRDGNHLVGESV